MFLQKVIPKYYQKQEWEWGYQNYYQYQKIIQEYYKNHEWDGNIKNDRFCIFIYIYIYIYMYINKYQ